MLNLPGQIFISFLLLLFKVQMLFFFFSLDRCLVSIYCGGDAQLVKWLALTDPMLRIGSSIPTVDAVRKILALSKNRPCGTPHIG